MLRELRLVVCFVLGSLAHRKALLARSSLAVVGASASASLTLYLAVSGSQGSPLFFFLLMLTAIAVPIWLFCLCRFTFTPAVLALHTHAAHLRGAGFSGRRIFILTVGVASICGSVVATLAVGLLPLALLALDGSLDQLQSTAARVAIATTFVLTAVLFRVAALRPASQIAFNGTAPITTKPGSFFDAFGLSSLYDAAAAQLAEWFNRPHRHMVAAAIEVPALSADLGRGFPMTSNLTTVPVQDCDRRAA